MKSKSVLLVSILSVILLVSGCTVNGEHTYVSGKCISCWNNPITGKAINHDNDLDYSKPESRLIPKENTFEMVKDFPHFVSYIRINNNLKLGETIKIYDDAEREKLLYVNGPASYRLKGNIQTKLFDKIYVDILISKDGYGYTKLTINYLNIGKVSDKAKVSAESAVHRAIHKALKTRPKWVPGTNYKV